MALELDGSKLPESYGYPPSPPSSATVTSPPSPRTEPAWAARTHISDPSMPSPHVLRRAISNKVDPARQLPQPLPSSSTQDNRSQTSVSPTRRRVGRALAPRALTMPAVPRAGSKGSISAWTPTKPHHHARTRTSRSRRSSSGSSTASSPTTDEQPQAGPSTAGIGRKVAESLQLFRESASTPVIEEEDPVETRVEVSLKRAPTRESGVVQAPSGTPREATETEYEFVKRSDWTEREAAAVRREKSTPALDRVRTKEGASASPHEKDAAATAAGKRVHKKRASMILRENVMNDLVNWRKDVVSRHEAERGRQRRRSSASWRERPVFDLGSADSDSSAKTASTLHEALGHVESSYTSPAAPPSTTPTSRPHSRQYPPSPSPSRSPTHRLSPASPFDVLPAEPPSPLLLRSPSEISNRSLRSPTPILTQVSPPPPLPTPITPDSRAYSPWTTDEESGWETGSATSAGTSRASESVPRSPSPWQVVHPAPRLHLPDENEHHLFDAEELPAHYLDEVAEHLRAVTSPDELVDVPPESLPHIPLQPFRNQVGGHSAIYKFTKRAVCKVRRVRLSPRGLSFSYRFLLSFAPMPVTRPCTPSYSRLYRAKTCSTSPSREKRPRCWGSSRGTSASCLSTTGGCPRAR